MGTLDSTATPSPPHQYPLAIQLKLYQAFIFSIPILFSIILFLLFYLFYLKRRAAAVLSSSTQRPVLPRTNADANFMMDLNSDMANELKNKLSRVIFDEYMEARDLLCCVCLGEFEVKEELVQVVSCKHMFHVDCIHHWLHNHSTCPLCRAPVHVLSQNNNPQPPLPANLIPQEHSQSDHHQPEVPPPELQNCTTPQGSSSGVGSSIC